MKQCENCIFYDKEYDELRQSGDDIAIVGQENKEKHYCRVFKNGIDDDVIEDMKDCKKYSFK